MAHSRHRTADLGLQLSPNSSQHIIAHSTFRYCVYYGDNLIYMLWYIKRRNSTTENRAFFGGHRNFQRFFKPPKIMDKTSENKPTAHSLGYWGTLSRCWIGIAMGWEHEDGWVIKFFSRIHSFCTLQINNCVSNNKFLNSTETIWY
jgi:hypothetical protein